MDLSVIWEAVSRNLATVSVVSLGGPLWAGLRWVYCRVNKKRRFKMLRAEAVGPGGFVPSAVGNTTRIWTSGPPTEWRPWTTLLRWSAPSRTIYDRWGSTSSQSMSPDYS